MENNELFIEQSIKEIQEKYKDQNIEISFKKNQVPKNPPEFYIDISIPYKGDKADEKPTTIDYILEINLSYKRIHLYTKSLTPLYDGRDILPSIIPCKNDLYKEQFNFSIFIEKLIEFSNNIKSINSKMGRFYLGQEYDFELIKSLNSNILETQVKHIEYINGKWAETNSLSCISDEYFCLFELSKSNDKKMTLVFYGSLRCLISFKKSLIGSVVTMVFNRQNQKGNLQILISSVNDKDMDVIMDTLIEKIKNFGFKMDIYQKREGELPKINIEKLIKETNKLEIQLKNNSNLSTFNKLMGNYEKAIEYYSAVNDLKYKDYNAKIQELLTNETYSKFITK